MNKRNRKPRTDADRLDFLQRQSFTRWVGYDHTPRPGYTTWPVFAGENLRSAIDRAMDGQVAEQEYARKVLDAQA